MNRDYKSAALAAPFNKALQRNFDRVGRWSPQRAIHLEWWSLIHPSR